jgi:hypothetical protein
MAAYQKISSSLSLEFDDDPYPHVRVYYDGKVAKIEMREFEEFLEKMKAGGHLKEGKVRITRRQLRALIAEACGMDVPAFELAPKPEPEGRVMGHGGRARMVRSALYKIAARSQSLHDRLQDEDELPEWVQAKVAAMLDDMHEIDDHLDYKLHRSELAEVGRVAIGPKNLAMIEELRDQLGDDDFISLLASKLNALDLREALRKVAAERELMIGGVQFF